MYFKLAIICNESFFKVPKNACFSAQNILDPFLSLQMYSFIPKELLLDQKIFNLRRMKHNQRGHSNLCGWYSNRFEEEMS